MAATFAFRFAPAVNPRSKIPRKPHCCLTRTLSPVAVLQFRLPANHQPLPVLPSPCRRGALSVIAWADKNGAPEGDSVVSREQEYDEIRGPSTVPERFRYLTKEVPESPFKWPWLIGLAFLIYAWRTVLWELSQWMKPVLAMLSFTGNIFGFIGNAILRFISSIVSFILSVMSSIFSFILTFMGNIGRFILAFVFYPICYLVIDLIQYIEFPLQWILFSLYRIRSLYFSIVAFAPVRELSTILLLTSSVLAIAEATSPNSVNDQQSLLIAAGLVGFGTVSGFLHEILFWLSLVGFFSYSMFIKKRDGVSAALPSVAVLTAIGKPWLRAISLSAYLGFSIFHYSQTLQNDNRDDTISGKGSTPPIPLVLAAVSIGINVAAAWIRWRHLLWMVA